MRRSKHTVRGEAHPVYWDGVLTEIDRSKSIELWRRYMQQIYRQLLADWLPERRAGPELKTDLFEEAVSDYPLLPDLGPQPVGLDHSRAIARAARARMPDQASRLVVGDLRRLPFKSGAISAILAGSTLDHFSHKNDIAVSLNEVARVLSPGGTLIVTFDNPHNPLVWIRNHLPFSWLHRVGLVPYYVGETYTRDEARYHLEAAGLNVTDEAVVAHTPRVLAIWLVRLVEAVAGPRLRGWTSSLLSGSERMARGRLRYRTGYYLAFRAQKAVKPCLETRGERASARQERP